MAPKDKFYNYIIDDMVDNTDITFYENGMISIFFPMYGEEEYVYWSDVKEDIDVIYKWADGNWGYSTMDKEYVVNKYGAEEAEVGNVFSRYGSYIGGYILSNIDE